MELSGKAGLAYFVEDFYAASDRSFLAAKWAIRLDWSVLPRVMIFHRHLGFPSLENVQDLYVTTQQGIRVKI